MLLYRFKIDYDEDEFEEQIVEGEEIAEKVQAHDQDADEDGPHEYTLPGKYEVCSRCHGTGVHDAPGISDHGLTSEDFAEDPDFREDYYNGRYDVQCSVCHGKRVQLDIDWERVGKTITLPNGYDDIEPFPQWAEAYKAYKEWQNYQGMCRRWDAEDAYTRRMESGGY